MNHRILNSILLLSLLLLLLPLSADAAVSGGVLPAMQVQEHQERMLIGVLDLDPNNVKEGEARAIAERLRVKLAELEIFDVIERNKMETILEEQGFQHSGACNDIECIVDVGKILGVPKMVAGSVSQVGTLYSLQVRIIDVETAMIEYVAYKDMDGIEKVMTEAAGDVAQELANKVRGVMITGEQDEQRPGFTDPSGDEQAGLDWKLDAHHSGWFVRLSPGPIGFTATGASVYDPGTSWTYTPDFSGGGFGFDLTLGRAVGSNIVLFFNITQDGFAGPAIKNYGASTGESEDDFLSITCVGTGIAYHLIPSNWWISTAVAFASYEFIPDDGSPTIRSDEVKPGFLMSFGKDWWLFRGFSFGLSVRMLRSADINYAGLGLSLTLDITKKR